MSNSNFGILLDNVGPSDLAVSILAGVNSYRGPSDIILFYENLNRPCMPISTALMHSYELANYRNPVITTSVGGTKEALDVIGPTQLYLYSWYLDWLQFSDNNYLFYESVYSNPQVKVIARSEYDANILRNNWNSNIVDVMPQFNVTQVLNLLSKE